MIIELYFVRNEQAIKETDIYCRPPGFTVDQSGEVSCWRSAVRIHCKF